MKNKTFKMTALALLLVGVLATSAFGWGRGPGYGSCNPELGGLAGANLTADQKAKIDELRAAHLKDTQTLRDQLWTKRDELRALWLETTPDQAKIQAAQQAMRSLRDQLQEKRTAFQLAVSNILTPEQKAKLKASLAGKRGPGRGFGPGQGCWGGQGGFGPAVGIGPAVYR